MVNLFARVIFYGYIFIEICIMKKNGFSVVTMKQSINQQIIEKLETIQRDISNIEMINKIDILQNTIDDIGKNVADKETIKNLSYYNKKSIVINYASLSIAYLGIGLTLLLASMKLIAIQYGIIFGVFFGGSIILAYVAYLRKKEFKK